MKNSAFVSCEGKVGYASKRLAERRIKRSRIEAKRHPYRCQICHCWHIGSTISVMSRNYKRQKRELAQLEFVNG